MKKELRNLIKILTSCYPNKSGLNFTNNYELFVAVLLSAQCTDKKVNDVTPFFFKKYPDFFALCNAKEKEVQKMIKPINYFKTKAKNLIRAAKLIVDKFNAILPIDQKSLLELPGVGEKSASVILACNNIPAFPVDTHVARVARRLGLTTHKDPHKISLDLKNKISKKYWISMHHALIWHGRTVCKARSPKCKDCVVSRYCPSSSIYR
ncbi:MAG: endonuclease III [Deltaproteobacteria bacterium]|nr:endonuclease III [Deltaproteobacteria bacterium]MCX7952230.1 endonuclease III [Deltaproteobacteria bacterium]